MSWHNLFRQKSITHILDEYHAQAGDTGLKRDLNVRDLTALGIAAIIGAGIFATIGEACFNGGPGVVVLFVFVAIACGFSALCYASFASMIPISGSAYTYAYASFGELFAWIIGWDLIIEYAIGNIAVAIGWSGYFSQMLAGFGIHLPSYFTTDFLTAYLAHRAGDASAPGYQAYSDAVNAFGFPLVMNIPAFGIVVLITWLVFIGIRESRKASNMMVALKLIVILFVIIAGVFYVQPTNWVPFFPNGMGGVMMGVSSVFFAYIGFDAISTTAEEAKNPQRDLPRSMIYSLIICTVLYILIALTVTGMVKYDTLRGVADPLAYIFAEKGLNFISYVVAVSAIVAMASVLLVFQLGQPRIWMSMSRDGLLPPVFAKIHPKYRTPAFATILTGFIVAIPSLLLNITVVTELTSIGTLFAFVLVCGGVLVLDVTRPEVERKFKIPFVNARWPLVVGLLALLVVAIQNGAIAQLIPESLSAFEHKIPLYIFLITALTLTYYSFRFRLSLIPVLGLLSCLYLMVEIPTASWWRFLIWLAAGLVIYFFYGRRHSHLAVAK